MKDQSPKANVVVFKRTGGADVLQINSIEMPQPAEDEILIQVKSIGLNRADIMFRNGQFVESPVFPAKLGMEAAGVVEKTGAMFKNFFHKGDKVNVIPAFSMNKYGTYGDFIVVPGYAVRKIPQNMSFDEAAALWTSYLTMYGMLVDFGKIQPGDFVVINAASSSTGLAAIQLINYCGGIPIALTTSVSKKDGLLKVGAKHVINTADPDFTKAIMNITQGRGANIILDPVVGKTFSKLLGTIAEQGKVFVYGVLSHEEATFPAMTLLMKTPTIRGFSAGEIIGNPVKLTEAIKFIQEGVEKGALKPKIDRSFKLNEIAEAHRYLETNAQFGKVVVIP
jgi:NADPH:quinone reductase-like Zn-dependent oxidoreductase